MTPAARLSAAIEIMQTIDDRRIPAAQALKDWGQAHRFAGSGDRSAVSGLVYDTLRRRASSQYVMGATTPRAAVIGMLWRERKMSAEEIGDLFDGSRFAPEPLTAEEQVALGTASLEGAPAWIAGDYPEWLDEQFTELFGEDRAAEGEAMSSRAPLDIRVNTLKAKRDDMLRSLAHLGVKPAQWSPVGLRIALAADARNPGIQAEPDFIKGRIEVQDEGSQLAAIFSGVKPGETVIDLCAGAGGKTLALAALMEGRGRLVATDSDKRQLAPIHERLARAGVHNAEIRTPRGPNADAVGDLAGAADCVVADAPCTGTGTWRRNPDAKWRMRPGALEIRLREQVAVLDRAARLVRPGGRLVYITCSVLPAENGSQIRDFLVRHPDFEIVRPNSVVTELGGKADEFADAALMTEEGVLMTPRRTGTDGFFVAMLKRKT